jgi:hypothetical protein
MSKTTYNRRELIRAAHVLHSPAGALKVLLGGALVVGVSYLLPVLLAPAPPNMILQLSPYFGWIMMVVGGMSLALNEGRVKSIVNEWIHTGNPPKALIDQMNGRVENIDVALDELGDAK